jgi:hypothetical protein
MSNWISAEITARTMEYNRNRLLIRVVHDESLDRRNELALHILRGVVIRLEHNVAIEDDIFNQSIRL